MRLFLLALVVAVGSAGDAFSVAECPAVGGSPHAASVRDTASLSCVACDTALGVASGAYVARHGACECPYGTRRVSGACSASVATKCAAATCVACTGASSQSSDGLDCVRCGNATGGVSSTTGRCVCVGNAALTESIGADGVREWTCVPCPLRAAVLRSDFPLSERLADVTSCQDCRDAHMSLSNTTGSCVCDDGYTAVGVSTLGSGTTVGAGDALYQRCVVKAEADTVRDETSAATFSLYDDASGAAAAIGTVTSLVGLHYYKWAAVTCRNWRFGEDTAACQSLANLCGLQFNTGAAACTVLDDIVRVRGGTPVHGWKGWADSLPFAKYEDSLAVIQSLAVLTAPMSFNAASQSGTFEWLEFRLAKWGMNGTLLGVERLTDQFSFCQQSSSPSGEVPRWLKYGVSWQSEQTCDLEELMRLDKEPVLYDLYVVDLAASKDTTAVLSQTLLPVPFRNEGLRVGNSLVNLDADDANDVLTNRFVLWDTVSGLDTAGTFPKVVRYASRISLYVQASADSAKVIRPPTLSIQYGAVSTTGWSLTPKASGTASSSSSAAVVTRLHVLYSSDSSSYWNTVSTFFVLCCIFGLGMVVLRYMRWLRLATRRPEENLVGCAMLVRLVTFAAGAFAHVVFWLLVVFTWYWLAFFKLQDSVFTLMPPDAPDVPNMGYSTFRGLLVTVFVCHAVRMADILWHQTNVDIFFVDWEKPKGRALPGEEVDTGGRRGVSVWRTILTANEWSEIQTERRTHVPMTLMALLFILRGLGLEYLATPQPTVADLTPASVNIVLHFANVTFWWLMLCLAQLLWSWAIGERFLTEPPTIRFIDTATVAKVSTLVMDERYHAYYLHCDAPYDFADGTMKDLVDHLREEEGPARVGRGLRDAPDSLSQCFELHLPYAWREQYDKLYGHVMEGSAAGVATGPLARQRASGGTRFSSEYTACVLEASTRLSQFVKGFVEMTEPNFKRRWEERGLIDRVLDLPPDLRMGIGMLAGTMSSSSVICADDSRRFEQLMWRGVEGDLLRFNILTFFVCELMWSSTPVSLCVAYLVDRALAALRREWGRRNMANKTLVDERFLH